MTNQERWIVYPILFLTLGITMRDKVIRPRKVEANLVRCNKLEVAQAECQVMTVAGRDGIPALRMGVVPDHGGRLEVCSRNGNPVVVAGTDLSGLSGVVETLDSKGTPQVRLLSTPYGGAAVTARHDGKLWLAMGHGRQSFGVFAEAPEVGYRRPLTWPWRIGPTRSPAPGPKKPPTKSPNKPPAKNSNKPDANAGSQ